MERMGPKVDGAPPPPLEWKSSVASAYVKKKLSGLMEYFGNEAGTNTNHPPRLIVCVYLRVHRFVVLSMYVLPVQHLPERTGTYGYL